MNKKENSFTRLTLHEMKAVKGGAMPPLFRYYCDIGGGVYANVCFAFPPDTVCGYASPCTNNGVCSPSEPGGCVY